MRITAIDHITPESRLAKPIYAGDGRILLQIGARLTGRIVERLREKGITYVYVQQEGTEDLDDEGTLDPKVRAASMQVIESQFKKAAEQMALQKTVDMDAMSSSFSAIVTSVLEEVMKQKEAVSLLTDVVAYDSYIFHHSLNVTIYALSLGKTLGLNEEEMHKLGLGAVLHDIGKMSVPEEVLHKPGRLTDEEFALIQDHTTIGFEMLRKSHTLSLLTAHCAYQHHERLDGSGYPRGIGKEDIHLFARIIAIADVFDAVTSHRVYRPAMLPHEGLELLYSGAGTLFDQEMVDAFARTIAIYPVGLEVRLNGGRTGIVSALNRSLPARPVVRVFQEHGESVSPYEVDLAEELSSMIESCDTVMAQRTM
ncbi:HD-GYP domain-containing protein [Alkalicoccus urumqiensis]|uniref:HD-GYP domain-containing protein n=1 Tax=Alkalicoccus urumqiensis TaxID=1548213 RepID=A0A2P6MGY0_ALKUR|nr:HD-GYP domain-containing protein [Alkalicoccus urumqiensis]PRO65539.1 hypothetical protein C6I21_08400 [Alkalicoccus urumqiensis]